MIVETYPSTDFFDDLVLPQHFLSDEDFTMTDTEYFCFCSEDLEYFQDDWTPSSNLDIKPRDMTMLELSQFLSESLFDESSPADIKQCSPINASFAKYKADVKHNDQASHGTFIMPMVHPVCLEEYVEHVQFVDHVRHFSKIFQEHDDSLYPKQVKADETVNSLHDYIFPPNMKTRKRNRNGKTRSKKSNHKIRKPSKIRTQSTCPLFSNDIRSGRGLKIIAPVQISTNSIKFFVPKKKNSRASMHAKKVSFHLT
jgi:hypothetical protein